ncbi:SSU ribosomal protein S6P [Natranaerovirga hydrolytica]|uniref:Small ribosomal subunit protein bS6 n=1 Tax=Natranaerovirga hydrolytica TaxID=680378 RepID=A0A4R1N130_9FIRM|nr:30S ribosomal protein S6 [Natranaerovirga hydrolytica]TCK99737.1 SSU ribosomal protein S6P [Natranaerovirga hydrolytica]
MNKYELALVINGKVEEDVKTATFEKVQEYITRFGGNITKVDEWGKKRLAYEIKKVKEGFYYIIQFEADNTVPIEVESRLRITEQVIRFLITRIEE